MKKLSPSNNCPRLFRREKRLLECGAALILVFWVLSLLGFAVFTASLLLREEILDADLDYGKMEARNLAYSALSLGAHPQLKADDPLLTQQLNETDSFRVLIDSEESRLPLNDLLNGEEPDKKIILRRLFKQWGMAESKASTLTDALADWVDEDDLISLNGAESEKYQEEGQDGLPYNRPFKSLQETALVRGIGELQSLRPDWRDYFSVLSTGALDLSGANAQSIAAVTGSTLETAEEFVSTRNGFDGMVRTSDDNLPTDLTAATGKLALRSEPPIPLALEGATLRVQSNAYSGQQGFQVSATLRRSSNQIQWLDIRESQIENDSQKQEP